MRPFMSTSKALRSLAKHRTTAVVSEQLLTSPPKPAHQIRRLSSIAGLTTTPSINGHREFGFASGNVYNRDDTFAQQKRRFLGCGDGEEGGVLSKVYEEKRVIGYSPEQLFDVVAAVDLYHGFVPWCQRSDVLRRYPDGSFDAELEIGFKFLVESYVSHVELKRPEFVKTTVSESTLFDHLINIWEFKPGPVPGSCDVHFFVDFKFQSPLYRQVPKYHPFAFHN
ncbi:hypothetical protein Tsubulata_001752 [Turnera subulata]|uniref:Coenzyme Q-binding protein COQ10 START domain-containing protein n=1 Tax=Turnera subulata TaxID=218843 RepID=A0A9Q0JH69_9ROSI|nr:hypothetical protein Tsubulata_001752 [Turnera subulata]